MRKAYYVDIKCLTLSQNKGDQHKIIKTCKPIKEPQYGFYILSIFYSAYTRSVVKILILYFHNEMCNKVTALKVGGWGGYFKDEKTKRIGYEELTI
jgi:hypothetical protein